MEGLTCPGGGYIEGRFGVAQRGAGFGELAQESGGAAALAYC
jgi:hypothetical protein